MLQQYQEKTAPMNAMEEKIQITENLTGDIHDKVYNGADWEMMN